MKKTKSIIILAIITTLCAFGLTACECKHSFTNYISDNNATCEEDGTETATCDHNCGEIYTRIKEGSALQHSYTNYVSNNDAKCEIDGTETATCDHDCGETHTRIKEGSALQHSFTNYISDNNATYEADGTKTATCDNGCGETDTIIDKESKLKSYVNFKTLEFVGNTANLTVRNNVTEFDFNKEIEIIGNLKLTVSLNSNGRNPIDSKIVDLMPGDNLIYVIQELSDQSKKIYQVSIRRNYNYTVSFEGINETQTIEEGYFATAPMAQPTKTGYTFISWNFDFNDCINANTFVRARWKINQYSITIVYNNGQENKVITANYNSDIEYISEPYKQYHTFIGWDSEIPSKMPADNLTITAQWQANKYTLTIVYGNGLEDKVISAEYNEPIERIEDPERIGYIFEGWDSEIPEKMPSKNKTICAMWLPMFIVNNGAITNVTSYVKENIDMVIPEEIDGITITKIADLAFYNCDYLTSVKIPNTITYIGNCSFNDCSNLKSVELPNNLKALGLGAFQLCVSLEKIYIPDSVEDIDGSVFSSCVSLTEVAFGKNVKINSINESLFSWCTKLKDIVLPNGIKEIGAGAFYLCEALEGLVVPSHVKNIGQNAFLGCVKLTTVEFAKNSALENIEEAAFAGCISLKNFVLPSSLINIGEQAINGCKSLTSLIIHNNVKTVGHNAFVNCDSLTIYCEAESKPSGWDRYWNPDNRPIVWGYKG